MESWIPRLHSGGQFATKLRLAQVDDCRRVPLGRAVRVWQRAKRRSESDVYSQACHRHLADDLKIHRLEADATADGGTG
jgi:hypothetical protein